MSIIPNAILALFLCLCLNNLEPINAKSFPIWPKNVSYRAEFQVLSWSVSIPIDVTVTFGFGKTNYYYSVYDQLNTYYSIDGSSLFIYPRIDKKICNKKIIPYFAMINYLPTIDYDWNHIMEKDGLDYWSSTSSHVYSQVNSMIFISRASDNSPVLLQATSGYPYSNPYFYPTRISYSNFKTDKLTIPALPEICKSTSEFSIESGYPRITFLLRELSGMVNGISYNENVIYHHEFSNFISKYSKSYKDKEEYNKRLEIFKQNLQIIKEHNKRTDTSYSLGITIFSDMSDEEFRVLYTNSELEDNSEIRNMLKNTEIYKRSIKVLPSYINWVEEGVVGPIKSQGYCSSCWAFSAISALESAWAIKTGDLCLLSEQQAMDCTPANRSACDGGLSSRVYDWISKHGISFEHSYPYLMVDGLCKYKYDSPVRIEKYVKVQGSALDLMDALVNHGPLISDIYVYNVGGFKLYTGGIYDPIRYINSKDRFYHSFTIVGYGTDILFDGSNKHYWLMKNSWGPYWGIKGYLKLARNMENNNDPYSIYSSVIYPVVN